MALDAETGSQVFPLAAEHERLRASWVELGGRRLPGHYGDDAAGVDDEYRAASEACSVVDLPERGIIEVGGPQRIAFLQRILSNEIAALAPGAGQLAALMNTKGQLLTLMRVLVESKRVALELDRSSMDRVVDSLEHYRVAAPVRFGRPEASAVALLGPDAPGLLGGLGLPVPQGANSHDSGSVDGFGVRVARASDLPGGTFVIHTDSDSAGPLWRRLVDAGALPTGRRAFDALRIEEGRPLYGFDIGEQNLLHETGLLSEYHSPAKGCYVGQEVVARLEARGGHVSRRLLGLRLTEAAAAGTEINSGAEIVGSLTTAAVSPRHGPIAMGYVHRSVAEPGQCVSVAGAEATLTALPLDPVTGEAP